ncbi:hypothetical protein N0V83_001643 [Neocucurbitaria cava]|uniref:Heterokaryon incompatibility domain-containing protein n=1 Tax=Neocucurbitaria cava TaxID=798079 RepID=A0A9W9CRK2_9PLEO|nr:hypothetical protein N0V83_001643 [Neocucurbitaria cava]
MDDANPATSYPAEDLDLHLRQIRLATILPGRYIDTVACNLSTAYVDDLPEYYSLSYVWGDRKNPRQILLNGVPFDVTRNLQAALRRLRHPTQSRLYWIDMICINQNLGEERTHQVNLMRLIYSRATEVFLWLGDIAETTNQEASPALQNNDSEECLNKAEAVRAVSHIELLATGQHLRYDAQGDEQLRLMAELRALDKLMRSTWWRRIWTVQEAILPPKVMVMVGWLQVPWATLVAAARSVPKHGLECCLGVKAAEWNILDTFNERVAQIDYFRHRYHQGHHPYLSGLLHDFRTRSSTDSRDKIFGLLGLVTEDLKYNELQADYSLPTDAVYRQAFIYLLQQKKSVNLLVRAIELKRTLDLPTWIPDWTAEVDEATANIELNIIYTLHLYNASQSTQSDIVYPNTSNMLGVKGLLFDTVATLPEALSHDPWPTEPRIEEYVKSLYENMGRPSGSYMGRESLARAFRRLFSMDKVVNVTGDSFLRATGRDYGKYPNTCLLYPLRSHNWYLPPFRFFITKKGYIGLGPRNMRVGDSIHIFLGGNLPFVLRQVPEQIGVTEPQETRYEYVGYCYVHGIMDGEALEGVDVDNLGYFNLV